MSSWFASLICPSCRGELRQSEPAFICDACSAQWPVQRGVPRFLAQTRQADLLESPDGDAMIQGYRAPSKWLASLRKIITSEYFPDRAWRDGKAATLAVPGQRLIIGSGILHYPESIHLDIDDFDGVDVVGDAHHLPFADNSMDAIICETVLEHVPGPNRVIAEAARVLKPGGRFFFIVPFLFPFHGHPNDFQRWTREGLKAAFADFEVVETGIHGGPCSAMVNLLSEWAYVLSGLRFPKGYVPIKGAVTAALFPIKFLDRWVNRFPEAHRMAATIAVWGHK